MTTIKRSGIAMAIAVCGLALVMSGLTSQAAAAPIKAGNCYAADLAGPLEVAPSTTVTPSSMITWTWSMKNAGTCAWTPGSETAITLTVQSVVAPQELISSPVAFTQIYLPNDVPSMSVVMIAPAPLGKYESVWSLQSISGTFGPTVTLAFTVVESSTVFLPHVGTTPTVESPIATPTASLSTPTPAPNTPVPNTPAPGTPTSSIPTLTPATPVVATPSSGTQPPNNLPLELIVVGAILVVVLVVLIIAARRGKKGPSSKRGVSPAPLPTPSSMPAPPPIESQKPCPHCNGFNNPNAKFCRSCGKPLHPAAAPTRPLGPSGPPTGQLPPTPSLTILPEGALIGNKCYRVLKVIHPSKLLNRYLAEGQQPVLHCPNCGAENPEGWQFCNSCGVPLAGVPAYVPRYWIRETGDSERFRTEDEMVQRLMAHPNLIPPRSAFDEDINDVVRHYVVEDEPIWGTAAQVTPPQELPWVLSWGIGLADGLAYLHRNQIVMTRITGHEVALIGKTAQWANFEAARAISTDEWQQSGTRLVSSDVRQLAALIYRLATGLTQYDPNDRALTSKANAVFARVFGDTGYLSADELAAVLREVEANVRRPGGIDVHVARLSDVGQERDLDEDSILTLELGQVYRSVSTPLGLYAVADGMGGHEGGDVASRLAIRTIARRAVNSILAPALADGAPSLDYEAWIKEAVQDANQVVLTQRKASRNDMGTTLVMAILFNEVAYIAHIGDSRAYLIRHGAITRLTVDHSLVERLVAIGQITREEAATHPQRNVIYRNIGDKPQVEPDIKQLSLAPGDKLLLCCDGLSGEIGDAEILKIIMETSSLPEACQRLIKAANDRGGHDNISVVLIGVAATG